MSNTNSNFSNIICINDPTDISGFEKEISKQILTMSKMNENLHDIEELIIDALKRRCNNRKTIIHAHLRLKHGATTTKECTMTLNDLSELTEMISVKGAQNEIIKRLANFYVRIAFLCNKIEHVRHCISPKPNEMQRMQHMQHMQHIHSNSNHKLSSAYAKNEETMSQKQNQNHRELDQIMKTLFLKSEIHPELTEKDLPALETQVAHIAERGCTVQELQRLKIIEAFIEENRFNQLTQELMTLTK